MLKINVPQNYQENKIELFHNNSFIGTIDDEDFLLNLLDENDYNSYLDNNSFCFEYKKYSGQIKNMKTFVATDNSDY